MLISDRKKKLDELKQAMRDYMHRQYGDQLPVDAVVMLFLFEAAAHVNITILGRNPDDVIKALRGEEPS
jgi:hypothetical protein